MQAWKNAQCWVPSTTKPMVSMSWRSWRWAPRDKKHVRLLLRPLPPWSDWALPKPCQWRSLSQPTHAPTPCHSPSCLKSDSVVQLLAPSSILTFHRHRELSDERSTIRAEHTKHWPEKPHTFQQQQTFAPSTSIQLACVDLKIWRLKKQIEILAQNNLNTFKPPPHSPPAWNCWCPWRQVPIPRVVGSIFPSLTWQRYQVPSVLRYPRIIQF